MPSIPDLKRLWLLKALGLASSNLSEADLSAILYGEGRLASAPIQGTGTPEGNITAPVGTEYVDINATNGAVKWIKTSSVGNTGWKVSYGDTGRRVAVQWDAAGVITKGSLPAGWKPRVGTSGSIQVWRQNDVVSVYVAAIACAVATTNDRIWTATPGFNPNANLSTTNSIISFFTSANAQKQMFITNQLIRGSNFAPAVDDYNTAFTISYITDDAWPTVLP